MPPSATGELPLILCVITLSDANGVDVWRDSVDVERILLRAAAHMMNAQQIFPVSDNARERTNFGIAEVSGKPAAVTLKIFDPAGNFLGATSRSIGAFGSQPLFNVLNDLGLSGVSGLRVEVEQNGEGLVTAYASVVERATGDAVYIPAE